MNLTYFFFFHFSVLSLQIHISTIKSYQQINHSTSMNTFIPIISQLFQTSKSINSEFYNTLYTISLKYSIFFEFFWTHKPFPHDQTPSELLHYYHTTHTWAFIPLDSIVPSRYSILSNINIINSYTHFSFCHYTFHILTNYTQK